MPWVDQDGVVSDTCPFGYCHCGCGTKTRVATHTDRWAGQTKGQPLKFIPGHQGVRPGPDYEELDGGYVTPCWIWQKAIADTGYGRRGRRYAHRIFYEAANGAIPASLQIDHLCRNRACVNPDHLEAVTQRENLLRGDSPSARQARQTRCKRGHKLAGENLYVDPRGRRQCKTCQWRGGNR